MKTIKVEITGETPLLMHSAHSMMDTVMTKNPAKQYDKVKEAEKVAYRTKLGKLCVPSRCVKACLINGASWFKFGKKSAKKIVAGCTRIQPVEIILVNQKYEIDLRPVVIQGRDRIIRARPRLDRWKLAFEIIYNEKILDDTGILKQILEEAGQTIGLLDNRPQKFGENGTFKITKWKVEE